MPRPFSPPSGWPLRATVLPLLGLAFAAACRPPAWPVPAPAARTASGEAMRVDVELPLCAGAASCADRDALCAFVRAAAADCGGALPSAGASDPCAEGELAETVAALARERLSSDGFPRSADGLPRAFRRASSFPTVDTREDVASISVAVRHGGLFWAFSSRGAPPPPDPSSTAAPRGATLDHLVLFRVYATDRKHRCGGD